VTIEGGPGWQLGEPPGDTIGEDRRPARTLPGLPRLAALLARRAPLAVVVAAALGFGSGTLLADWRTDRLGESDAGTLSLEVTPEVEGDPGRLGRTPDDRPARMLPMFVRNTGPREVALDRVWLAGTDWAAEDAAGRRIAPRKGARVTLLRPIDCDRLEEPGDAGPFVMVRAVTDAGVREHRVPVDVDHGFMSSELDRWSCGELPAEEAVQADVYEERHLPTGIELMVRLANRSRYEVTVTAVRAPAGLRVQLLDESARAPLAVPLRLPADRHVPRDLYDDDPPSLLVVVRVTLADCELLAPTRTVLDRGQSLLEMDVVSELGTGVTDQLEADGLLHRLTTEVC